MASPADQSAASVTEAIDRELVMIRGAIDLVASGGAPRVVLSGLQFGDKLLGHARRLASLAGVSVIPLWTTRSEGADLAFEMPTP